MSVSRVVAAAAAALVVTVICGSQLTTGALWASSASFEAGTVTSGRLDLVSGTPTERTASHRFTALDGTNLRPGSAVQAPLTVANAGDIDHSVRLAGVTQSNSAFRELISVRAIQVDNAAACPTTGDPAGRALYDGPLESASSDFGAVVPVGATSTYCLRVQLASAATSSAAGASSSIVFTFSARQGRHV